MSRLTRLDQLVVYKDTGGQWRWKLIAPNGESIASSGESFTRRWSAWRAGRRVLRSPQEGLDA